MPLSKINKFYFFTSEHGNVCKANELTIIILIIIIIIIIIITITITKSETFKQKPKE